MTSAVLEGLIHSQDWERTAQARMRAFRGGPRYDVEHRVVRPNGDVRVVHSRVDVTKDESGRTRRARSGAQPFRLVARRSAPHDAES